MLVNLPKGAPWILVLYAFGLLRSAGDYDLPRKRVRRETLSPTSLPYDAFLSHNGLDKVRVRRLAERLRAADVRVWFDEWEIKPGDDIYLAVEKGLQFARVQILCLSAAALKSGWVTLERSTVLFRDPSNVGRRFIPLLLSTCELPDTLRRYKYIDYRNESGAAFEEILDACKRRNKSDQNQLDVQDLKNDPHAVVYEQLLIKSAPRIGRSDVLTTSISLNQQASMVEADRRIAAHNEAVNCLSFSADGKRIASASADREVRVWNASDGKLTATLRGHVRNVWAAAFGESENSIVSASVDRTIRVWNVDEGKCVRILRGHTETIRGLCSLPGERALSASYDRSIRLWDLKSGKMIRSVTHHNSEVNTLAVTLDGVLAVSGADDGTLVVWRVESLTPLFELVGHADIVIALACSRDGRYLLSGSNDKTVRVWDLGSGKCIGVLEGHTGSILSIAVASNNTLAASCGLTDETVRIWNIRTGECLDALKVPGKPISLAFKPDASQLLVGSTAGEIFFFAIRYAAAPAAMSGHRYVNAKIVLVGESAVGKTTLAHRLIEDQYIKTDSTHGMNVWRLELPIEADQEADREALLWDLAGQEDYRLIHQLYLDSTALALVLINPQKDDPFTEAEDWLKALRGVTRNNDNDIPKLLIATRLDVGGVKVSQAKIDRFINQNGIAAFLPTSANRGDNCSDKANENRPSKLKELIAQHIPWNRLPWTSTPRLLIAIKNTVLDMRDQADIRLLRFAELYQRLKQVLPDEEFVQEDVRTALALLANHGLVQLLKFGDLVLLSPELLNGYAASIIRAAREHKDEIGCVQEDAIYDANFDFTGVNRLVRSEEELLLRALVQTLLNGSLCIRESDGNEMLLIFPSQYRRDRELPSRPAVTLSYTFSGELQSIYASLIVRLWYSRTFGKKELWQNAAEFTTSKGNVAGVVFDKIGDGKGRVSIFFDAAVPDELKVVFVEFVHRHLARRGHDLHRERWYFCTCGEPVTNQSAVQKRLLAGKDYIVCQVCDRKISFNDHIEERLNAEPVFQKVLAMEAIEKRERDAQSLEQELIGHMMAITAEANQVFRDLSKFDYGIDGEVEFKDNDGHASGRKIYVQLKNGNSYLRKRKTDGKEVFDVKALRHLDYWVNQPVDVYLVIRDSSNTIRWMNLTAYLKTRSMKHNKQVIFDGEKLDVAAVWRLRDKVLVERQRV